MADLQVLLDPRGVTDEELRASVSTLLLQVPTVELVHPKQTRLESLTARFGRRVTRAGQLRTDVPVLVASGRVCFASCCVRRILAEVSTPGRLLTRVLIPHAPVVEGQVTCWSPQWIAGYAGTLEGLVDADLDFDREHLPGRSSVVRSWIRADAVGVALASTVGEGREDPQRWSRRVGRELVLQELVAGARAPAGALRRRIDRSEQRRRYAATSPVVAQPEKGAFLGHWLRWREH